MMSKSEASLSKASSVLSEIGRNDTDPNSDYNCKLRIGNALAGYVTGAITFEQFQAIVNNKGCLPYPDGLGL